MFESVQILVTCVAIFSSLNYSRSYPNSKCFLVNSTEMILLSTYHRKNQTHLYNLRAQPDPHDRLWQMWPILRVLRQGITSILILNLKVQENLRTPTSVKSMVSLGCSKVPLFIFAALIQINYSVGSNVRQFIFIIIWTDWKSHSRVCSTQR